MGLLVIAGGLRTLESRIQFPSTLGPGKEGPQLEALPENESLGYWKACPWPLFLRSPCYNADQELSWALKV